MSEQEKSVTIDRDKFTVIGKVIDVSTQKGVPGLVVHAWDKDLIGRDDSLGHATTDETGKFQISFGTKDFQELVFDRRPDLYFEIFEDDKRIHSTRRNVIRDADEHTGPIVIKISRQGMDPKLAERAVEVIKLKHIVAAETRKALSMQHVKMAHLNHAIHAHGLMMFELKNAVASIKKTITHAHELKAARETQLANLKELNSQEEVLQELVLIHARAAEAKRSIIRQHLMMKNLKIAIIAQHVKMASIKRAIIAHHAQVACAVRAAKAMQLQEVAAAS